MLKQENNENEQKTKCGKNIDQSRKKIKNTLAYTHKYTKHLTKNLKYIINT
jgi:DNA-binding transcriptional regulator GbsR (MarR family)